MIIYVILSLALAISIIIEILKGIEVSPPVFLFTELISISLGLVTYAIIIAILLPISRAIQLLLTKIYVKGIEIRYIISSIIKPFIYILIAISLGMYLYRASLPLMDPWSSSIIFLTIVFLVLSLTVEFSIEVFSYIGYILSLSIDSLISTLNKISIIFIIILIPLMIIYLKLYTILFILFLFVSILYKNRVKSNVMKIMLSLLPFSIAFILSIVLIK